jgi:hypothetical protein
VLSGRAYDAYTVADGPPQDDPDSDAYVARLTADGVHVFDARLVVSYGDRRAVAPTPDGGLALAFDFGGTQTLAGVTLSAPGLSVDMAFARFDAAGVPVVAAEFDAPLPDGVLQPYPPEEYAADMVVDAAGNLIVTGHGPAGIDLGDGPTRVRGMYVTKVTSDLTPVWAQHHTAIEGGFGVAVALHPDGDIVAAGYGFYSGGGHRTLLVKLPP